MGDVVARPQFANDLGGLLQHLQPGAGRRPPVAQDVFVQRLSAAETETELALPHQHSARRGGLGDDRRMGPTVGQVTAVVIGRSHTCDKAPIIDQTKALSPWTKVHG